MRRTVSLFLLTTLTICAGPVAAQQNNDVVDPNAFATPPPRAMHYSTSGTSGTAGTAGTAGISGISGTSGTSSADQPSFFVRPKVAQPAVPYSSGATANQAPPSVSPSQWIGQFLNGQADKGSLSTMITGEARQLKSEFTGSAHNMLQLTASDRRDLANCDLALIIDHSGSMKTRDCPGFSFPGGLNSRLEWVVDELMIFANQIIACMPHGFSLITFDNNPDAYQISNVDELRQVLGSLRPGGGTRLEAALDKAFQLHEAHINQPLLIAVITDGEVNVRESEQIMAQGTRAFPLPNGVAITVLQVGAIAEQTTAGRIQALSSILPMGAAYEPLSGVPFSRLRRDGLGNDVLHALRSSLRRN